MKLYCVRHGHATPGINEDGCRPLSDQGIIDVQKVAAYLKERQVHVSHVMHSNKLRAVQTAQVFASAISTDAQREVTDSLLPNADISTIIDAISDWDDDTLIVGHMPYLSHFVSELLVGSDTHNIVRFTPATVVCLERYEHAKWILNWVLRPDLVLA